MREEFKLYVSSLFNAIPNYIYVGLLALLCLGLILILVLKREGLGKFISRLLLAEYLVLLFCSMILFRRVDDERKFLFELFWSYQKPELLVQNVMNVIAFIPVGFLLGSSYRLASWRRTLIIGAFISVIIESIQFFLKRGFSEFDDIIHNTFGCIVGYVFYCLARFVFEKFPKRNGVFT